MTSNKKEPYGDPITYPFWEAAERHELLIQHCPECDSYQFYPRPFCLACNTSNVEWVQAKGGATIYSMTTVHVQIAPQLNPPYVAAVIELDEGPRMLTNIEGGSPRIGDRVKLAWREREDAPPLPIWTPVDG
jgi:uncharacterized OB-fold protein